MASKNNFVNEKEYIEKCISKDGRIKLGQILNSGLATIEMNEERQIKSETEYWNILLKKIIDIIKKYVISQDDIINLNNIESIIELIQEVKACIDPRLYLLERYPDFESSIARKTNNEKLELQRTEIEKLNEEIRHDFDIITRPNINLLEDFNTYLRFYDYYLKFYFNEMISIIEKYIHSSFGDRKNPGRISLLIKSIDNQDDKNHNELEKTINELLIETFLLLTYYFASIRIEIQIQKINEYILQKLNQIPELKGKKMNQNENLSKNTNRINLLRAKILKQKDSIKDMYVFLKNIAIQQHLNRIQLQQKNFYSNIKYCLQYAFTGLKKQNVSSHPMEIIDKLIFAITLFISEREEVCKLEFKKKVENNKRRREANNKRLTAVNSNRPPAESDNNNIHKETLSKRLGIPSITKRFKELFKGKTHKNKH